MSVSISFRDVYLRIFSIRAIKSTHLNFSTTAQNEMAIPSYRPLTTSVPGIPTLVVTRYNDQLNLKQVDSYILLPDCSAGTRENNCILVGNALSTSSSMDRGLAGTAARRFLGQARGQEALWSAYFRK